MGMNCILDERLAKRGIRLFLAAAFLDSLCFYAPVASLYRLACGVNLFQITVIESCFFAVSLLLEIPWGLLTDRIGPWKTLLAASALRLLAGGLFLAADGFWMFLLERCVLAASVSGFSGCDTAFLGFLAGKSRERQALGWYNAAAFCGLTAVGILFPAVSPLGYRALAALTVLGNGLALAVRLFLPKTGGQEACASGSLRAGASALIRLFRDNRPLFFFVMCGAVLCEAEHTFTVFFGPAVWKEAGVPESWYGILNLCLCLSGVSGSLASAGLSRVREGGGFAAAVFWCLALASSAGLCLTGGTAWCIVFLAVLRFAAQGYVPWEETLKLRRTDARGRAAALSAYEMASSLAGAAAGPLIGAGALLETGLGTAKRGGAAAAGDVFFAGGMILLAAALAAAFLWRKIRQEEGTVVKDMR
ncbi:Major Facilitator Superfamily [[Clostridium] cf. saccharolyticum K10]|nr:Major Facilitator Superfamily [[Clostridium] cf. saccharolyticum K10]